MGLTFSWKKGREDRWGETNRNSVGGTDNKSGLWGRVKEAGPSGQDELCGSEAWNRPVSEGWKEDSEERKQGGEGFWGSGQRSAATGMRMVKMVERVKVDRQAGVRASGAPWATDGLDFIDLWQEACRDSELVNRIQSWEYDPPMGRMETSPTSVPVAVCWIGNGPDNYWASLDFRTVGWSLKPLIALNYGLVCFNSGVLSGSIGLWALPPFFSMESHLQWALSLIWKPKKTIQARCGEVTALSPRAKVLLYPINTYPVRGGQVFGVAGANPYPTFPNSYGSPYGIWLIFSIYNGSWCVPPLPKPHLMGAPKVSLASLSSIWLAQMYCPWGTL